MKQRLLAMLMAVALCVTCVCTVGFETKAEDMGEDISFSELMTENALVGYAENITRGVYLLDGYSVINKISSTKIGAGGTTTAAVKCRVITKIKIITHLLPHIVTIVKFCVCIVRMLKINFQVYIAILLTIVTMLYISSPELMLLKNESFD